MCEIAREDDMKNINQNICNNEYKFEDNEVLESTKLSNRIIVLVANRLERRKPK
jgi:hypothetical protein